MIRLLMVACMLVGATTAFSHEEEAETPTVQVSSSGWVEKAPEVAQVTLAVETVGKTAKEASKANAGRMVRVMKALLKAGVEKSLIRTVGYHVYPRYDDESRRGRELEPVGYTASNSIEVTVDPVDRAGDVIDAAIEAGANRSNQLEFGLKDPDAAHLEALADAMRRARMQANVLARSVGKYVGDAVLISTHGDESPGRYLMGMRAMKEDAGTPIEGGPIRTTASVEVTFVLTPFDLDQ